MSSLTSTLSKRERDIFSLLTEGLSDAEIAAALTLQLSTIKWYNRQIFNKLGVSNRHEAMRLSRDARRDAATYHLPAPTTPFVGRQKEVSTLCRLIKEARIVTVLAPGGMGKTRLILAAAERVQSAFKAGVCYLPLEAVPADAPLTPVIARALGLSSPREADMPAQLRSFLRQKSLLLALDNFEHLLDQAPLLTSLLEAASGLRLLIGSRERLHLHGEALYSLGGLRFPTDYRADDPVRYDALDLLEQCARRLMPDFALDAANGADALRVCQLTGGMPLALELAAAWLKSLTLGEIAGALTHRRDLFTSDLRDLPDRHASINTVLIAAWERLTPDQRAAYMRLSVFRGGGAPTAARAITGAKPETLSALVDHALLRLSRNGRYTFHELLRQYAEEQLRQSGHWEVARSAHSAYYLSNLAARELDLKGAQQAAALDAIDADFANIRAAWLWAVERRQISDLDGALESLYWFGEFHSHMSERATLLRAAIRSLLGSPHEQTPVYGRLLTRAWSDEGFNALPARASTSARRMLREGRAAARAAADSHELAVTCFQRGLVAASVDHKRAAVRFFALAQAQFAAHADDFYAAQALLWGAFAEVDLMRFADAETHARAAIYLLRQMGEQVGLARALLTLGAAVENKPDYAEAERCYEEAYNLLHSIGAHADAANVGGWYLAGAALRLGDFERYRLLGEELMQMAETQHIPTLKARALGTMCGIALVEGDYELARARGELALPLCADGGSAIIVPVFLAYAYLLLGETARAQTMLLPALQLILTARFLVFDFVTLPLIAALLAINGFDEHAGVAYGVAIQHPASMRAWTTLFFERIELRARLEARLSSETLAKLMQSTRQIDPLAIIKWVIEVAQMSKDAPPETASATRRLTLPLLRDPLE